MEHIKKRINVKLINYSKEYLKCLSKPNFISQKIFDKIFIAVHQIKTVLTLNKPIYVGFCILELSKLLIYKFHYDYVLNTFNAKLLFTDTDSLVYEIKDKDVYEQCFKDGYPVNSKYYYNSNQKVLGKMKDEKNMKRIQSKLHEIGTYDVYKISLSCFDDKRYVLEGGINTLAYFHKDIKDL